MLSGINGVTSLSVNSNFNSGNMKALISLLILFLFGCATLSAQSTGNPVVDVILSGYSQKAFSTVPVTDQQLDLILKCGMKAPSARNSQNWKFIVVKTEALQKEIIPAVTSGNILIVIAGADAQQPGMNSDFDCALATENMYVAAQGLGLGAHIYASPVGNVNAKMKEALGIPEGYSAKAILRISSLDKSVDAVSAASPRKKAEEVIIYK